MATKPSYGLAFYNQKDFNFAAESDRFIAENVVRILMTTPGERVNNLSFGSKLRSYLFQPEMLMEDLAREIVTSVNRFEPRAEVVNIEVSMKEEVVYIKLTIKNKTTMNTFTQQFNANV